MGQVALLGLGAVGTLLQARSASNAASAQASAIRSQAEDISFESQAASINAERSRENAAITREQYAENERRFRQKTQAVNDSTRAQLLSRGLSSGGSAEDVLAANAAAAELDALTLRYEGQMKSRQYELDALDQDRRARYLSARSGRVSSSASTALDAGRTNAATALLSGINPMLKMVGDWNWGK